jgi:hypothetical protein
MRCRVDRFGWTGLLLIALTGGCSPKPADNLPTDQEGPVREKVAELQATLKSGDSDKLWALLSAKSQADAERAASAIKTAYTKATTQEEKTKQEEATGLTGTELAGLKGKGFLKTKRFQKKYHELPDSKIEKVTVEKGSATVHYLEPDGDNEKLILLHEDGQWKAWLTMPKGRQQP